MRIKFPPYFLILSLYFLCVQSIGAQVLEVGENLSYSVSWLSFEIGEINMTVIDSINLGSHKIYKTRFIAQTTKSLPYFMVNDTLYSDIDDSIFSHGFISRWWTRDSGHNDEYEFDYESSTYHYSSWNLLWQEDTLRTTKALNFDRVQDGVSSIYYTRSFAGVDTILKFPTVIKNKIKWTHIEAKSNSELVKLNKNKVSVDAYRIDGKAKYDGFKGFNGSWRAWFSVDPKHILVYAEIDVLLGRVKIELKNHTNN